MSSVNTPSLNAPYKRNNEKWPWFIVCRENLHRKPFQRKVRRKISSLFSLFFYKQDNACRSSDFVFSVTMRLQMKAPQMQFALSIRSQHVTDEPFTGTAYFMLFSRILDRRLFRNISR